MRLGHDEHFISSTLSAVCCVDTFTSFPSERFRVYLLFRRLAEVLHTSDDLHDLVIDHLDSVIDASHPIVDGYYCVRNSLHPLVNSLCELQILCSSHPSFFLCQ